MFQQQTKSNVAPVPVEKERGEQNALQPHTKGHAALTVYTRRDNSASEGEAAALAAVYSFVLQCHKTKAANSVGPDEVNERNHVLAS